MTQWRVLGSSSTTDGWCAVDRHRWLARTARSAGLSTDTMLHPAKRQQRRGGIARRYSHFVKHRPFLAGGLTVGGLALLGDAVAQSIEIVAHKRSGQRATGFDWARCAALTGYGALWNGPFNVVLYATYVRLFGTGTALAVALGVAADQLVWMPFGAIPMAFFVTDTIQWGILGDEHRSPPGLRQFVARLQHDWRPTVQACWMVWVPVEIINMWLVPLHLRVAFGAFGSFCWMVALSLVSSSGIADVTDTRDRVGEKLGGVDPSCAEALLDSTDACGRPSRP